MSVTTEWWRDAVIYQVYPRSFADADGDGVGDLDGVRAHLGHLSGLGVDAIWMGPWYPSPMADAGYDVADFRSIAPVFGTLEQAEALIREAHAAGIRIIIDLVPNHVSSDHPWFRRALDGDPEARSAFHFTTNPQRSWEGEFGGPAWTDVGDGTAYLHLFTPEQPDLNWENPRVRAEFEDILRFWLDRGVDGIRIDSAALLVKDMSYPRVEEGRPHPFHDRDGVHEIYRAWRRIADAYPDRALIGEVWLPDPERFARYLRPDELHSAFNFDFLGCAWDAGLLRACVDRSLATQQSPTWVLSNHDVTRHVTRYGREVTTFSFAENLDGSVTDLELGTRRARAAALLTMSLPGSVYVYQGEELGLWEHEGIAPELFQDPMWSRRGHSRDGCRVPMPWSGDEPPFGFSTGSPWLPQPPAWKDLTVAAQTGDPSSMLELYRRAVALRREISGPLRWLPSRPGLLRYARSAHFVCLINLSPTPEPLPPDASILLASGPLEHGCVPPDTAVWLVPSP